MDRSRLAWLLANWCMGSPKCFTCKIKSQYRRIRRELFPVLSRIQNIGDDLAENTRPAEWYRANHRTPAGHLAADKFSCSAPIAARLGFPAQSQRSATYLRADTDVGWKSRRSFDP
jgi:hypothetical protein